MYTVTYVNPSWSIRTNPEVLETRSVAEVRRIVANERTYPGSCRILSITKTTKAHGTVALDAWSI